MGRTRGSKIPLDHDVLPKVRESVRPGGPGAQPPASGPWMGNERLGAIDADGRDVVSYGHDAPGAAPRRAEAARGGRKE